ncbi:hypothetical protein [Arcobacter sp. YIC-310]|uniref:hypothetical protein n=1 Tax=Arcobacter sp. YIC-310 TaxID=3376632 RepID=UPI003C1AE60D
MKVLETIISKIGVSRHFKKSQNHNSRPDHLISKLGGDCVGRFTLRTSIAAVVGGTVSQNTGGKFANGAVSGAFTHMFNAEMAKSLNQKELEIMRKKAEANALSMDKSVSSWRTHYKVRSDLNEINEVLESNIGKINNVGIAGASIGANYGKSFGKEGVILGVF